MKYRCCKNILPFFLSLILFLHQASHISAAVTQYNPTQSHDVRSSAEDRPAVAQPTHQTAAPQTSQVSEVKSSSFLEKAGSLIKRGADFWLLSFVTGLLFFGRVFYTASTSFFSYVSAGFHETGLAWIYIVSMPAYTPSLIWSFVSFPELMYVLQNVLKSGFDMQLRGVVALTAITTSIFVGSSWQKIYEYMLRTIEEKTHWKVGDIRQDVVWAGGFASVAGMFIGGGAVAKFALSVTIHWESLVGSVQMAILYLIKESKSAFTETDKECKDRAEQCSDPVEKGIILAFNYLPGGMPDLGLSDGIISIKRWLMGQKSTGEVAQSK